MSQPFDTQPVNSSTETATFTPSERKALLELAHEAILSAVEGREISDIPNSPSFNKPRGVFTTLYLQGKLKGCVGYPFPIAPLVQAVIETARDAAFADTRFEPVTAQEACELEISLNILSPLAEISPEQIEIGKHGLLISQNGRRGLLLPEVSVEHGWDKKTFLEQTCRKAGLQPDAWSSGAKVEAFAAEAFSDLDFSERL